MEGGGLPPDIGVSRFRRRRAPHRYGRPADLGEAAQVRGAALQEPLGHLARVPQQVPAVEHLRRVGRAAARAARVLGRAVADDDLDARVGFQPLLERCRRPVGQQVDRAARLQIDQHRAVPVALAPGPVVHPEHPGRDRLSAPVAPEQPQERVAVGDDADVPRQARPRLAPEGDPERGQHRLQADRRAAAPGGRAGHLLRERPPGAVGAAA